MESGNDAVTLGNVDVVSTSTELASIWGLKTTPSMANGSHRHNQIINGGDGDDQLIFEGIASPFTLGTSAGGNATWTGGNGNDTVHVIYAFIVGTFMIDLGAGTDSLNIFGSAVSGNVSFFGGSGADNLTVDTNFFDSDMLIDGGADGDSVFLANGLGTELATVNTGGGSDSVTVRTIPLFVSTSIPETAATSWMFRRRRSTGSSPYWATATTRLRFEGICHASRPTWMAERAAIGCSIWETISGCVPQTEF